VNIKIYQAYLIELSSYQENKKNKNLDAAWISLERAHIFSQYYWRQHFYVHFVMLIYALQTLNLKEIIGQLPRMILAIPGSVSKNAPLGNTGRSNISMFKAQDIHSDVIDMLNDLNIK
jgi:hypothetical protein